MKYLVILMLLSYLTACTTHPHSEGRSEYNDKIENNSAGDKQFAGLYHNFEFRSTLLTQDVTRTIHKRMNKIYEWDESTSNEKWQKMENDLQEKTTIWLSFFTPEGKNDNLANKVSIWKIYLDANGTRYEGRARKANKNLSEAKTLFPYHTRWATAYYVDFEVPTAQIEADNLNLIITGPLGRREVSFK